jgi:DNA-binding MarR family transcriptional regulator
MGWITDFFEGIPLSDEALAKISILESQVAVIESEKVQLKLKAENLEEKVRQVEREKQQFQQENQDLRKTREFPIHGDLLNDPQTTLLVALGNLGPRTPAELLAKLKNVPHSEGARHLQALQEVGYVQIPKVDPTTARAPRCNITPKGRQYLDDHFLR